MVNIRKNSLKDKVLSIMNNKAEKDRLFSLADIRRRLGHRVSVDNSTLQEVLDELENEGKIIFDRRGLYRIFSRELGYIQGRILIDEVGNGYVEVDSQTPKGKRSKTDYKIRMEDLNDALTGDIVLLKEIEGTSKGHPLARVEKIVKRNSNLIFCNVVRVDGKLVIDPEPYGFKHEVVLKKKDMESLHEGQRLLVSLDRFVDDRYYLASVHTIGVSKVESKVVLSEAQKQEDYSNSDVLYEVEAPLYIDGYMNGIITLKDGSVVVIDPKHLQDAISGDIVTVQVLGFKRNGCYVGEILNIVERKDKPIVCDVKKGKNGRMELVPCGLPYKRTIILDSNSTDKLLVDGDRIQVFLGDYDKEERAVIATFDSYIGNKNDASLELRTIAIDNGIDPDFTEEALKEAETLPREVREEDRVCRVDLTNELIFSIDDETCKDRDDAISIKKLPNGNYEVGIHISDVSYYIHPGMALWEEAKRRSTSAYLSNIVFPMLPKIISNGICSLDEGVDRLTVSTFVELGPDGKIINYRFEDTIINSKKAMTYTAVNEILEKGTIPEGYEEFADAIRMWGEVSDSLEKIKLARGAGDYGSREIKSEYDRNGNVIKISPREIRKGNKLIENAMLLTGQCYADYMDGDPTQYRVHDEPEEESIEKALDILSRSGFKVISVEDVIDGKNIERILKNIKETDEREIVSNILLRAQKLARYDAAPGYHFGLALNKYGQITSPIRRFMDLLGQHRLKQKRRGLLKKANYDKDYKEIASMCGHSTMMERNADKAEREADRYDMSRYISQHIHERFAAQVTYVNSSGMYIRTREGIEGRIKSFDVEGMHLMYDEATAAYRDKKTRRTIRIGDRLIATALATDEEYRTIRFGIRREDTDKILKLKKAN